MAISKTQGATGNGATITLNGVAAGALLTLSTAFYRGVSTAAAEATPTDSAGTFEVKIAPAPILFNTSEENGSSVFFIKNAGAGTHTATPQANTIHEQSYTEFAGADVTSPSDVSTSGGTSNTNHQSRTTGTTGATAQADEVVLIGLCIAAVPGVANIGFTDPVVGYTTLRNNPNSAAGIAVFHAFKVISSVGTQSATFNWTDATSVETSQAVIATFKAAASAAATPAPTPRLIRTDRVLVTGSGQTQAFAPRKVQVYPSPASFDFPVQNVPPLGQATPDVMRLRPFRAAPFLARVAPAVAATQTVTFDPALMAAMSGLGPTIVISQPQVVASGMAPPDNVPN